MKGWDGKSSPVRALKLSVGRVRRNESKHDGKGTLSGKGTEADHIERYMRLARNSFLRSTEAGNTSFLQSDV